MAGNPEGFEIWDRFEDGEPFQIKFGSEAAQKIVDEAVMEGTSLQEVVRRGIGMYVGHQRNCTEGLDGPYYYGRPERARGVLGLLGVKRRPLFKMMLDEGQTNIDQAIGDS